MARPHVLRHAVPLKKSLESADQLVEQSKDWTKNEFDAKIKALEEGRTKKIQEAEVETGRRVAEAEERRQKLRQTADEKYPARLEQLKQRRNEDVKKTDEKYPPKIEALKKKYTED